MSLEQFAFEAAWAVLGWLVGSLLDPLAYQLPRDLPLSLRARCASCGRTIRPLGIRGPRTCQGCGESLGFDRMGLILAGLMFLLAASFGAGPQLVAYSVYTVTLLVVSVIDARHRYVFRLVTLPGVLIALILGPLLLKASPLEFLTGMLVSSAVFAGFYGLGRLIYRDREPIGKGDIEIAALLGAMVGLTRVPGALFWGSAVNGIFILVMLLSRRRGLREFVPYGPGLCAGGFIAFFTPF